MLRYMDRRPLLWLSVAWIVGMGFAYHGSGARLVLVMLGCFVIFFAFQLYYRLSSAKWWVAYCIVAICGAAFFIWTDQHNVSRVQQQFDVTAEQLADAQVTVEATIVSPVEVDGDRVAMQVRTRRLILFDQSKSVTEKLIVQVRLLEQHEQDRARTWQRGDRIQLVGTLKLPGVARNFGSFDYRAYLLRQRIHWMLQTEGLDMIQVESPAGISMQTIVRFNDRLREAMGHRVQQLFTADHAGLVKGLLIGDRDDMPTAQYRGYTQLGLTHILAISGTHVAVYIGGLLFLLRLLRCPRELSYLIVMCCIPPYVLLSGAAPSVIRAGLMAMITLYALRRHVLKDGLHILSVTAWVMLLWNPYYIVDVSFQLSFIVTAGLIIWVPRVIQLLPFRSRWLASLVAITCVAQAVSFPLTIYYFNQVSLLSMPANFVIVPAMTFVLLPLSTGALFLSYLHMSWAKLLVIPIEWLHDWIYRAISALNQSLAYVLIWATPPIWWIACYYIVLELGVRGAMKLHLSKSMPTDNAAVNDDTMPLSPVHDSHTDTALALNTRNKRGALRTVFLSVGYTAIVVLLLLYAYYPAFYDHKGYVQFLDVGQGDSILIRTGAGKHILVDGGGTFRYYKPGDEWKARKDPYEVGRKLLVPLLKQRGVHQLDVLVLTHQDMDHAGGLQAVLEEIPVKAFLFNGTFKESDAAAKLFETAVRQRIPLYRAVSAERLELDQDTALHFLYPAATNADGLRIPLQAKQNDLSVIFELHMKQARFLFTGDISQQVELELLQQWTARPPESISSRGINVMKAAHHGSKSSTSEAWLRYWQPSVAVISAGVNNVYGHPHPQVLKRLQSYDVKTYRTDLQGEVQLRVDQAGLEIRTKLTSE